MLSHLKKEEKRGWIEIETKEMCKLYTDCVIIYYNELD